MAHTRILVTGATGNVGEEVVRDLLGRGVAVRVAVRDVAGARRKWGDDIDCAAFDFGRPETFAPAFEGIERLFLVRPPALADVKRYVFPAVNAAVRAGVRHVVFLSLLGAEKNVVVPHHKIEAYLEAAPVAFTFLRAGFFMQNLSTTHRSEIRDRDEIWVPAGRGRTSFVDVRDVAAVGAAALVEAGHENRAYDLTGPRALSYEEAAGILTDVLGRRIRYRNPSVVDFWRRMRALGQPRGAVLVMAALYTTAKLGLAGRVAGDVAQVLGRPPLAFETFARDYRSCWIP